MAYCLTGGGELARGTYYVLCVVREENLDVLAACVYGDKSFVLYLAWATGTGVLAPAGCQLEVRFALSMHHVPGFCLSYLTATL